MKNIITEHNFLQYLFSFTDSNYQDDVFDSYESCPYDLDLDHEELIHSQLLTWFIYERINPQTRITILEEFVNEFVNNDATASQILKMNQLFFDKFKILESKDDIVILKAIREDKIYKVQTINPNIYPEGAYFFGRIHPWYEDGTHRMCGVNKSTNMPPKESVFRSIKKT